jgi:vacuolar-type H+-ATPase subunit B/Vma2
MQESTIENFVLQMYLHHKEERFYVRFGKPFLTRFVRQSLRMQCSSNERSNVQRDELGALVSLEMGKIKTEGIGEVQEFIDIVSVIFEGDLSGD